MKAAFLIGRLLFAGFFINSGISHLQQRKSMAAYARARQGCTCAGTGGDAVGRAIAFRGCQPVARRQTQVGSHGLLGFLAGGSPVMHDFWRDQDPDPRMNNMIMFMKNLALAGGALALMGVDEPWEAGVPVGKPTLAQKARKVGRRIAA